jgi:hypothetical protein
MKLARHMPRIGSGISYALVLFASLFCFDLEPSSGPDRLVPQEVIMSIDDAEAEAPTPETKRPAPILPFLHVLDLREPHHPPILSQEGRQTIKTPSHFDARGPPFRPTSV